MLYITLYLWSFLIEIWEHNLDREPEIYIPRVAYFLYKFAIIDFELKKKTILNNQFMQKKKEMYNIGVGDFFLSSVLQPKIKQSSFLINAEYFTIYIFEVKIKNPK